MKKIYTLSALLLLALGVHAQRPVASASDNGADGVQLTGFNPYDENRPIGFASGTTGSADADMITVTNESELRNAVKGTNARTVFIKGTVEVGSMVSVGSNKTIYGLPGSALSNQNMDENAGIFSLNGSNNVIIRNVTFLGPAAYDMDGNDNLTLSGATNVWIDHCDIQDGMDGNLDIVNGSDNVSVTWTKFSYLKPPVADGPGGADDHRNCNLIGNSDSRTSDKGKLNVTFVSCWWSDGCHERCPRVRFGRVHIANSLYSGNDFSYCIGYGAYSNIYAENNAFTSSRAQKTSKKDYSKGKDHNITMTGNLGASDFEHHKGANVQFVPDYDYTPYDVNIVEAAVSDDETGAGATLDIVEGQGLATAINAVSNTAKSVVIDTQIFSVTGARLGQMQRGLNIVVSRMSDGTTRTQKIMKR